jgi:hypothetical protein
MSVKVVEVDCRGVVIGPTSRIGKYGGDARQKRPWRTGTRTKKARPPA